MTEAEWLACTDFDLLWDTLAPRATARKSRLLSCALCRRSWHLLPDEPSRRAVEVAERYADGLASPEQLGAARAAVFRALRSSAGSADPESPEGKARSGVWAAASGDGDLADVWSQSIGDRESGPPPTPEMWSGLELLRELVGNPFRTAALDPAWLAWQGGRVPELARAVYWYRLLPSGHLDPARLAALADDLEDAGCADAEVLGHLRGPGPHVRGCWAVDLLLGKS